jgi:hypothetical protein
VLRATMSFWAASGGAVPLDQLTDAAFRALADGFPENAALRDLPGQTGPAGQAGSRSPDPVIPHPDLSTSERTASDEPV